MSRHFSLIPEPFAAPRAAMRDSRLALLLLLGSALVVVSCGTWIERGTAPSGEEGVSVPRPAPEPAEPPPPVDPLAAKGLRLPVEGPLRAELRDSFRDPRGSRLHEALDILAPRGTAVVAVDDGRIAKVYRHKLGGLSVYQYDAEERYVYYYAHLDAFAPGLHQGQMLRKGDRIGTVGTSGNAGPASPHLHFAIYRLGPERRWWRGTPVNPFPYLAPR